MRAHAQEGPISLLDSLGEEKLLHILLASGLTEGSVDMLQRLRCAPSLHCIRCTSNTPPYYRERIQWRPGKVQRFSDLHPVMGLRKGHQNESLQEQPSQKPSESPESHQLSWKEQGQSLETWETKRAKRENCCGKEAGTEHPRLIP